MGKVSNSLNMLLLLSNNRKYTIKELSDRLEVTPRMIRFYKEEFEKAGIFIDTIRGPYGGYVLTQPINLPDRKITESDIELLRSLDKNSKIEILIDKLESIHIKTEISDTIISNDDRSKYNAFVKSNNQRRKVKIEYKSMNGNDTTRIIHPLDMFLFQGGWCISSYCELRQNVRNFEIKRILKYEILDEKF